METKLSRRAFMKAGLTGGLVLAIPTLVGGNNIDESKAGIFQGYELEKEGDPKAGTIYFLRQRHRSPYDSLEDEFVTGNYQNRILEELYHLKVKHIFNEGTLKDFGDFSPSYSFFHQEFTEIFPKGAETIPSFSQLGALYYEGAGMIYVSLNPGTTLHKVAHSAEFAKTIEEKGLKIARETGNYENIFITDLREFLAKQQITNFLESNPGERVALIYGKAHEFRDDFMDSNFLMYSKSFQPLATPIK
jgi:hypothetical protein